MITHQSKVVVYATAGTDVLAKDVCSELAKRLPIELQEDGGTVLSEHILNVFANDNTQVQVGDVRGKYVVFIHTQVPPVNNHLVELLALIQAVRDAKPADMLLVFPYMPFSRSDYKNQPRISTMGQCLPNILNKAMGIEQVILLDPHDVHIKQYFDPTSDDITAMHLLCRHMENNFFLTHPKEQCTLVFADAGSAKRFELFAKLADLPTAYINKDRPGADDKVNCKQVVGDVSGRHCLIIDDEILTGGTAIGDANCLLADGAASISMVAVHAVLEGKGSSKEVVQKLEDSPISSFVVTDSIPVRHKLEGASKFEVVSVAPFLAESIKRVITNESVSALRDMDSVNLYCN